MALVSSGDSTGARVMAQLLQNARLNQLILANAWQPEIEAAPKASPPFVALLGETDILIPGHPDARQTKFHRLGLLRYRKLS